MKKYPFNMFTFCILKWFTGFGPHITVINHDADPAAQHAAHGAAGGGGGGGGQSSAAAKFLGPPLTRGGSLITGTYSHDRDIAHS